MDSDFCYGIEMKRAMERHEKKEAQVIPVILRSVYWQGASFGKLQALPHNAKPVVNWGRRNDAFFNISEGIRKVVEALSIQVATETTHIRQQPFVHSISFSSSELLFNRDEISFTADDGIYAPLATFPLIPSHDKMTNHADVVSQSNMEDESSQPVLLISAEASKEC
jgi:hypothetical protein